MAPQTFNRLCGQS